MSSAHPYENSRILRGPPNPAFAQSVGWRKPRLDPSAPIVGKTLGQRILAAAQRAGVSKSALGERVGRDYQTINNWTKGKTNPNADDIRRVSEVTGVTLEELLGVASGQEPDTDEWRAFCDLEIAKTLTADERRTLSGIPWIGLTPTVESYLMALAAVRAAKKTH